MISYVDALELTLQNCATLGSEHVGLVEAVGRIAAENLVARVDSPSLDVSLKDGYAVHSSDCEDALPDHPSDLKLVGEVSAGGLWRGEILPGEALQIYSGAPLPPGTDAVISQEFTRTHDGFIEVFNDASPGRNVLHRGEDITRGQLLAFRSERLTPGLVGQIAAGGISRVPVCRQPRITILATGDEVVAPGNALEEGRLFASNLVTLAAWCSQYGFAVETHVVGDDEAQIRAVLQAKLENCDAILTSGGAWKGEFDFTVRMLDQLGWQKVYHRVRIGPGKAVGFGLFSGKPVFCLPGGPPSNYMAFLQLALPGLKKMAGYKETGLPRAMARATEDLNGQQGWTEFFHGQLRNFPDEMRFTPIKEKSRLSMIAVADAIAVIPEDSDQIHAGQMLEVQLLTQV